MMTKERVLYSKAGKGLRFHGLEEILEWKPSFNVIDGNNSLMVIYCIWLLKVLTFEEHFLEQSVSSEV
jgi:hypothetical protein